MEILSVLSVEHDVDVLAQRDGTVTDILADEGSQVEQGAVLARLDDRVLAAQLDRSRAELEVAEANVRYNEAETKAREAIYHRAAEMQKLKLNSQADLEKAEFEAKGAEYDLEGWRATVERTRADIRLAELEIEKTRLVAPFSGAVTRRYIRSGQNVLKDEKCFHLSQLMPLRVRMLVPEVGALKPQVGASVRVALTSSPGQFYTARVATVSPIVDPASGSYEVTAQLTGPNLGDLRPGMSVRVLWPRSGD
jgi:RND family efflux transporter MFP subunit